MHAQRIPVAPYLAISKQEGRVCQGKEEVGVASLALKFSCIDAKARRVDSATLDGYRMSSIVSIICLKHAFAEGDRDDIIAKGYGIMCGNGKVPGSW